MLDTVNERIRNFRRYSNLSQDDLAKELGYKTSTYSQKERKGNIDVEFLVKLSKLINADFLELAFGREEAQKYKDKIISDYLAAIKLKPEGIIKQGESPEIEPPPKPDDEYKFTQREYNIISLLRNMKRKTSDDIYKVAHYCFRKRISLVEAVKELFET